MPARGRCDLAGQGLAARDARSFGVTLPASVRNTGVVLRGRWPASIDRWRSAARPNVPGMKAALSCVRGSIKGDPVSGP